MYQILKRQQQVNHAWSDFYPTNLFFLHEANALKRLEELYSEITGMNFVEVIDEDEDYNQIFATNFYQSKDCYIIEKIVPLDEEITLPF